MNNIWGLINRLGMARIAAMAVVAIMLLGFFVLITFRVTAPQMAPLYTGLTFDDSAAIVRELQSQNVMFELRGDGEAIMVPRDQITQLRMNLAESGLPSRGQVGYEIFDEQNTLGATSFVQNINQLRALEGELARTISSLARIRTARVHLVLPERELFRRERKDPTASIVVGVRGELASSEIRAIQHLVSSAIEGLTPTRVSIVDDAGRLLASGAGTDDSITAVANEMEERTLGIETRLRARVEEMLSNVLGPGRARVQVSAEIDMNRLTRTSETFDPDGQVVRSSQLRETTAAASGPGQSGQVTVANELPGATTEAGTGGTQEQNDTTEETTNFEISKVTETEISEAGSIKRLSVAVVVDGRYIQDADGAATYEARTAEELEQISAIVRSAIGFTAERGDQVEIANLQFAERPELAGGLGTEAPGLLDFTRDDIMNGAEMAVTLLISLALLFFVLRPLVKRVLEPDTEPLSLASGAQVPAGAAQGEATLDEDGNVIPAKPPRPDWIGEARLSGEAQVETLKDVGGLVEENPKQSALVVRDWLSQAA